MKSLAFLFIACLLSGLLTAQEKFSIPQLTDAQKSEVLYSHVFGYSLTGISFAKSQGVTPKDYGKFVGKQFTAFWDPAGGYPVFVNRMMFILAGMHPNNQMEIVEHDENSITFKLKNVDLSFQNGPMFGVSYDEFLECADGIISEIAGLMKCKFSHKMTDDGWYVVYISKK